MGTRVLKILVVAIVVILIKLAVYSVRYNIPNT